MSSGLAASSTMSAPSAAALAALEGLNDNTTLQPRALRILVVEDEPGDAAHLDRALRLMPHFVPQVMHAHSVANARNVLRASAFDVLIVDYSIADEFGTELVSEFGGANSSCPVILVSGLLTPEIEYAAFDRGAAACLDKSDLTSRVLENVIRQAIRGQVLDHTVRTLTRLPQQKQADQQSQIIEQIVASAKIISEELALQPRFTASHWEAVKLQSLVQSVAALANQARNSGSAGQPSLVIVPASNEVTVDLQDILLDAGKEVRRSISELAERDAIRFSLSDKPLMILGNPQELVQAFAAILARICNTAHSDNIVEISTRSNRSAVSVRIGHAFAKRKSKRSLEPAYVDISDWPVALSEARKIVHQHGGAVEWAEEIGKDTGVLVTLPLAGRKICIA